MKFAKFLLVIIILVIIVIGSIFLYKVNIVKNVIDGVNNCKEVGITRNAIILEDYDEKDGRHRNRYTFYASENTRLVKLEKFRIIKEDIDGAISEKQIPTKTIYIDLNNKTGEKYNGVIEVDNEELVYREIDDYEFYSPIQMVIDYIDGYYPLIDNSEIDYLDLITDKRVVLNVINNHYIYNYVREDSLIVRSTISDNGLMLNFCNDDNTNSLLEILFDNDVVEIDVTCNDLEDYTKV